MSALQAINLWFCAVCGVVTASQRRLPDGAATVEEECPVCNKVTTHSPVALQPVGRSFRFVTRV